MPKTRQLTEAERTVLTNALHVAAQRYDEDAKACQQEPGRRLATQFEQQALNARTLADQIEEVSSITLSGDIESAPMPWCQTCECYHHFTAPHKRRQL